MHGVHLGVVGVGFAFGRAVVAVDFFLEVNDLPRAISRIGGAIIEFDLLPRAVGRGGTAIVEINCRGKRLEFAVGECARLNFRFASEIGLLGRRRVVG